MNGDDGGVATVGGCCSVNGDDGGVVTVGVVAE